MPFDANKLYASEILSILLQNHEGGYRFLFQQNRVSVSLEFKKIVF